MCGEVFETLDDLNNAYPGGHAIIVVDHPSGDSSAPDPVAESPPPPQATA